MENIKVPDNVKAGRPWGQEVDIGPPPGIGLEDCAIVSAWTETLQGGFHDGLPVFNVYYKPSEREISMLNDGGSIQLSIYAERLVMHSVSII